MSARSGSLALVVDRANLPLVPLVFPAAKEGPAKTTPPRRLPASQKTFNETFNDFFNNRVAGG
jgi:hypothetical protein